MKLTCIFLVLIGASFALGATSPAPGTKAAPTTTSATATTAAPTTTNETVTTAAPTTTNETVTTAALTTTNETATTAALTTTNTTATTAEPTTPNATTTTAAPTTTMAPTTTWRLEDANNDTCILEQMQADFFITYEMVNAENKTIKSNITFMLPQVAMVDAANSACGDNETMPMLTLVFDDPVFGNKFEQFFTMSANNSALTNITLALNHTAVMFPNSTQAGKLVMYSGTLPSDTFMVSNGQSYLCNALRKFNIDTNTTVTFSKVKVQTADIIDNKFGNVSQCPQDTPSTSPAPTSSMAPTPTPTPFPPPGSWNITYNNHTCMLINMSLQFVITYNTSKDKVSETTVSIPAGADSSKSVCGVSNTTSKFVLTFFKDWILELDFSLNTTTNDYNNTKMMLTYSYDDHFVDPAKNGTATATNGKTGIHASVGKCYSCMTENKLKANNVTFVLHDVKIQPFALKSNETYGAEAPCDADNKINNIVPIAVGCALAGLVIIVLIAYLIGRQRSSKSGYESV